MGNSLFFAYIMGVLQLLNAQYAEHGQETDEGQIDAEIKRANDLITQRKELLISEHNDVTLEYEILYVETENYFVISKPNNDATTTQN